MRVLLVTGRPPWPPRRGDQLRTLQILDFLVRRHRVTLLVRATGRSEPSHLDPLPAGVEVVEYQRSAFDPPLGVGRSLTTGQPLQAGLFHSASLQARIRELAPRHDLVVLQLARLIGALDAVEDVPCVVDLIDALSLNFRTRARFDRPLLRPLWAMEAERLARAERQVIAHSVGTWVVCERDREVLVAGLSPELQERVAVVRLARSVVRDKPSPRAEGHRLVMTGNFGYFVNRDALDWFSTRVWPQLGERGFEWTVAGSRLSKRRTRRLERLGVKVQRTPTSLGPVHERAGTAIAPMRCGSGVPVKVLEAWSQAVPVVASRWAALGTEARSGEQLLAASEPHEWVEQLESLRDDPQLRAELVDRGNRMLRELHAPEVLAGQLERWLATHL